MHYRALEKDITTVLKANFFDTQISQISYKLTVILYWWLKEILKVVCRNIHLPKVDFLIHTDASQTGWGGAGVSNPTERKW